MTNHIVTLTVLSLVLAVPAFAKTFTLPNEEFAMATITFPNDWEPEEINNGVSGQSPDDGVYMSAVAVGSNEVFAPIS